MRNLVSSTIGWDEYFMRQVYLVALKSKDPKTKIGAVLVIKHNPISSGYNGFPIGVLDLKERYLNREIKYKFIAHAEANAISIAARLGIRTCDSILYTQGIPCNECCKTIIQAGIRKIIVHKQWPNLVHSEAWLQSIRISEIMLKEADVTLSYLDKVLNIDGFLDGKKIKV